MTKPFNWKIFFILVAAATVGLVAIIPYSLALQGPDALARAAAATSMPLPLLLAVQIASQVIVFAVAIWVGLSFANSIGLGLPILESALKGEPVGQKIKAILPISIILGVVGGLLIIALDLFVFHPALVAQLGAAANPLVVRSPTTPTWWQGLLASFYGGLDEEILLRLCVMSFLAWLGRFVAKTAAVGPAEGPGGVRDGKPTVAVFWVASVIAAVLFGLGHLPATATLVPLTPLVVLRAVVLNGIIGVATGYLYFTRGLESAMVSHFSADIILHVLFAI
jgi:membrane protease YdiL (CAAX protease family)